MCSPYSSVVRHLLVVEDDFSLAEALALCLSRDGFAVTAVQTAAAALSHVAAESTDMILLDLGLRDCDGVEVCGGLRRAGFDGGLIVLTGRSAETDRVVGLDAGADDYVTKPFSVAELQARVRAVVRRIHREYDVDHGALEVDRIQRCALYEDRTIALTRREFDLLDVLLERQDHVIPTAQLLSLIWPESPERLEKALRAAISRLRVTLHAAGVPYEISSVRGHGYRLSPARKAA